MLPDSSAPRPGATATPDVLPDRFAAAWQALRCPRTWRRVVVAVSGGPDSLALLHLLLECGEVHGLDLVVGHVDHGIHPDSSAVARGVAAECGRLGVPVVVGRLALGAGASETRARAARHAWLEATRRAEGADAIVLAHHADDQAETVLLRVLRGSGPAGLAGMSGRNGRLVRPMLRFPREELAGWLRGRGVKAWEDPANLDPSHDRSWIRTQVLPLLTARDPAVAARLQRLGRQAAVARRAWDAALSELPGLDVQEEVDRVSVAGLPLATFDEALAVTVLQAVARRAGLVLGAPRAAGVLRLLRRGRSGASLDLPGAWRAESAFGRLAFHRARAVPEPLRIEHEAGEVAWGSWRIRWRREAAPAHQRRDGGTGWFIGAGVVVRPPRPADRLVPLGGTGRRPVARLLQEARVARSRRPDWPVLEVDGAVAWVAGLCRGEAARPSAGQDAWRVEVSRG